MSYIEFARTILNHHAASTDFQDAYISQSNTLKLTHVDKTGCGLFLHFSICTDTLHIPIDDDYHSTKFEIEMDKLDLPLSVAIKVLNGVIDHLEVVTIDEIWDGEIRAYRFVDRQCA